jgi:hypothetical protein
MKYSVRWLSAGLMALIGSAYFETSLIDLNNLNGTNPGGQASGLSRALLIGYEVLLPIVRR